MPFEESCFLFRLSRVQFEMAIGKSFLDQYSVICVFGSVVGWVVVPLIAQVRNYDRETARYAECWRVYVCVRAREKERVYVPEGERVSDRDVGFYARGSLSFPKFRLVRKTQQGYRAEIRGRSESCDVHIYMLVLYPYLSYVSVV